MRKTLLIAFLFVLGTVFITTNSFAAWTQAKGHSYNQLTFSEYLSDEKYTTVNLDDIVDNHREDAAKFISRNITYYGAYGITDSLTLSLTVPYKSIYSADVRGWDEDETGPSGIGDIDVGLRTKLVDNLFNTGFLMSVDTKVKIPAAYDYEDPTNHQSLGDGQYDAQLSLVFGKGFSWGYGIIDIGYKYRFENTEIYDFKPSDQFKLRIDGGTPIGESKKLWLRGSFDWSDSVGNSTVADEWLDNTAPGRSAAGGEEKLKRDTLSLESDSLTLGVALAYSFTPKIQSVIGYEKTVESFFGMFETKDTSLGSTMSLAFVYMH